MLSARSTYHYDCTMKHVLHSFICMCQQSCLQHRTWEEMKVPVQRIHWKLDLKMTDRTHTDERKMVQLYYLVPGCVISMFKFILIYQSEYASSSMVWRVSTREVALYFGTWCFRHTAKYLVVAYVTSWSLTLNPTSLFSFSGMQPHSLILALSIRGKWNIKAFYIKWTNDLYCSLQNSPKKACMLIG